MKISGPKKFFQIFLSDLPWMASGALRQQQDVELGAGVHLHHGPGVRLEVHLQDVRLQGRDGVLRRREAL